MSRLRYIYPATVDQDGNMVMSTTQREKLSKDLKTFKGKNVQLVLQSRKKTRSVQQNKLWWLYMRMLSEDIGWDVDDIHEICKMKFLKQELVNEKSGEIFIFAGSTALLDTFDFSQLVTDLQQWAALEFGINLPSPDEQVEFDWQDYQ